MEFKLADRFGTELSDVDKAQNKDYPILDNWLRKINVPNQNILLNANGLNYIGYSYAKQTFRKVITNLIENKYNFYSLSFKYDQDDFEKKFDGLNYALNQREYSSFWVSNDFRYPKIIGFITTIDPQISKSVQRNKANQKSVLEYILKKKELFTNDISDHLNIKLPNTNRILKELEEKRLIRRVKETSPSGGPIYLNKSVFAN
jgi:hypothetical protein